MWELVVVGFGGGGGGKDVMEVGSRGEMRRKVQG